MLCLHNSAGDSKTHDNKKVGYIYWETNLSFYKLVSVIICKHVYSV